MKSPSNPSSPNTDTQDFWYNDRRSGISVKSPHRLSQAQLNVIFTPEVAQGSSKEDSLRASPKVPPAGHQYSTRSSTSSPHRNSHLPDWMSLPNLATPKTSPRQRNKLLFYHKHNPHYGFTNFSDHPVDYNGKKYPTSEHLFQSFKFQKHRPNIAEHIRTCSERPSVAFSEARRFQPEVRPDWKKVNIAKVRRTVDSLVKQALNHGPSKMDITLAHKFTQHEDLKQELLATGDDELIEDSDKDAFWGVGADGKGRNELGKALERLRDKLRGGQAAY
ncbi:hypothetical protein D9615_009749 [Tricholomella constricta]|uniref:NADAR domain-containing protein n=1 Tax=Tricholomella constricta TaxID=117010 RepID=A0A8H5LUZ4_9AGAR|nr:hypothetical protein D9615_009749 [Tricholomella constricta]